MTRTSDVLDLVTSWAKAEEADAAAALDRLVAGVHIGPLQQPPAGPPPPSSS
jgi:hypothetical protein